MTDNREEKLRDEEYVIALCDQVLGHTASRQHRFDFLRGDGEPGMPLPVDAYYEKLSLVIEYREKQHSERVGFWDDKQTTSGIPRGEQRKRYDQRRREVLPQNGITLVEISYADLAHGRSKRLSQDLDHDFRIVRKMLGDWTER